MLILDELKKLGVDITPEMEKKFEGDFISVKEHEKKIRKYETEKDALKTRAETAEETLKSFEGKDFDQMQKEVERYKTKAEEAEKEYSQKLADREKDDLLKEALGNIKFTSESAKRAIMAEIKKDVTVKNGALIGFNDLIEKAKEADASAFIDEKQQKLEGEKAKFTTGIQQGQGGAKTMTKEQIRAIKDPVERRKAIAENMHLYQEQE